MIERRHPPAIRVASSRSLAHEGSSSGTGVFDNTREFAAQALERAAERMRELRDGMAGTASAAQRRAERYADATSRYVSDQPMKSALLAAGAGALVMAAILLWRRNRRY